MFLIMSKAKKTNDFKKTNDLSNFPIYLTFKIN